jgi:hypothetical protein
MTESCSGVNADFSSIRWYVVPDVQLFNFEGQGIAGYFDAKEHLIVVAAAGQMFGPLVRHEMLHALLGVSGHPRSQFLGRCGGLVVCQSACIRDAGPPPVPGASLRRVAPESLQVKVSVEPVQPSGSIDLGYFETVVTARNGSSDSIVVTLPPPSDAGPPVAFRFDWRNASTSNGSTGISYDDRAWDPQVLIFGPGETKQRVFDLRVAVGEVLAGSDVARGAYGAQWSAPLSVSVGN